MMYVFLILGFLLLIKGADYFVEASSSVARALRIPSIIIGLTIVAFAVENEINSNLLNLLAILEVYGIKCIYNVP